MACDVDVGRAHLVARGQVGQGQRHVRVVRHQVEHPGVEAAHGVAQQAAQVKLAPIGGQCFTQGMALAQTLARALQGLGKTLYIIWRGALGSLKFIFSIGQGGKVEAHTMSAIDEKD